MPSQRQIFFRAWIVALVLSLAGGFIAFRPDSALRTLWHSRQIAFHGNELSDRALRDGGHLRAVAPEVPTGDEEMHAYALRLQSIREDIARNHQRARRHLTIFAVLALAAPLLIAGLSLVARHLGDAHALANRPRAR